MKTSNQQFKTLILITILLIITDTSKCVKYLSINKAFKKGIAAYSGERWSECIVHFEEAIHLYKLFISVTTNCRLKCSTHLKSPIVKDDIEDLKMFETFVNRSICLNSCMETEFNNVELEDNIEDHILDFMKDRKPYEYLHICYFQKRALLKAASSAFTYFVAHTNDTDMMHNLRYYTNLPEVDINEVTDLEGDDYVVLYRLGVKSYKQGNWGETVAAMEEVLTDYLLFENNCRAQCEHLTDHHISSEFVITVTGYIKPILQCKQACQKELEFLSYKSGIEFIADILNYLQISYYHLDRVEDAAKALESYLMLLPNDEDMLSNKRMYSSLVNRDDFAVRSEITYYYKRNLYELNILSKLTELEYDHVYM